MEDLEYRCGFRSASCFRSWNPGLTVKQTSKDQGSLRFGGQAKAWWTVFFPSLAENVTEKTPLVYSKRLLKHTCFGASFHWILFKILWSILSCSKCCSLYTPLHPNPILLNGSFGHRNVAKFFCAEKYLFLSYSSFCSPSFFFNPLNWQWVCFFAAFRLPSRREVNFRKGLRICWEALELLLLFFLKKILKF